MDRVNINEKNSYSIFIQMFIYDCEGGYFVYVIQLYIDYYYYYFNFGLLFVFIFYMRNSYFK